MVTIKDVARECGVAISTVSNVLNHVDNVSEETKKKVLEAVERLKYVPNMNARYLKSGRKNTVGLFLSSIQGDYYRALMQAVHLQCKLAGFMLNIYVSNENTAEEIYGMLIASGVEGAIILNESLTDEYIDRLSLTKMPIVFCDREYSGERMSSVFLDNYTSAVTAMEYLVKLGHRRIGYFHGIPCKDDRDRYQAYQDVLKRHQMPLDTSIILNGYFEEAIAFSEMSMLIHKGITLPEAFFCANDEMAWGVIRALSAVGIQVPEQISVIGFDDSNMAAYYKPALTTVLNPVTELGSISATELLRLIRGEGSMTGTKQKLTARLVTRESCKLRI